MNEQKGEPVETLTKPQLLERLDRQRKLLQNRKFLEKLPDKGEKIQQLVLKLEQLIAERERMDDAMAMFSELSLRGQGQAENGADEDMQDLPTEEKPMSKFKQGARSKKTIFKTNVPKNPKAKEEGSLSETWNYRSAITNPNSQFSSAKTLSVGEAMKLQEDQTRHVQELETEKAAQRLQEHRGTGSSTINVNISNPYKYRDRGEFDPLESESSGSEAGDDEEQECVDDDILN